MKTVERKTEKRLNAMKKKILIGIAAVALLLLCVKPIMKLAGEKDAPASAEGGSGQEEGEVGNTALRDRTAEKQAEALETSKASEAEGIGKEQTENSENLKDPKNSTEETLAGELPAEQERYDIMLSFAGDICFDESCAVMQDYIGHGEKLKYNIAPELLGLMQEADVCWINNEFSYSDRGAPLENKMYTFRAEPKRAAMLKEMGVDIAGLANNHVYDYGPEAMEDTLDTLRQAGIAYVGAGKNLEEAMMPVYQEIDGKIIAYVAASRAEKYKMTPQATESEAGILRCYDTELFLEEIRQAKEQADYVIALVHWGTEYSTKLEEVQMSTGRDYIDAGVDIVIGAHTHCLQGMEYYRGKPIIYSLGNFWFNNKSLDTMLLQVHLSGDGRNSAIAPENVKVQVVPAKQEECRTRMLDGEEAEELFDYLEGISAGVVIDGDGMVIGN